jgi:hypothetical protein
MAVTLILVLFAGLALGWFVFRMRSRQPALADHTHLDELLQAVDLEAFRNLIDDDEERFLRENLPPAKFRSLQRQRLRAAIDYIAGISHNAGILLHFGQVARTSPDPQIAEAGRNLVDNASRLRLYALSATAKLYGRMLFPGLRSETAAVTHCYEQMRECASLLSRLRDPANAGMLPRAM